MTPDPNTVMFGPSALLIALKKKKKKGGVCGWKHFLVVWYSHQLQHVLCCAVRGPSSVRLSTADCELVDMRLRPDPVETGECTCDVMQCSD